MQNSNFFFYNEALSDNAFNGRGDIAGVASLAAGTHDASLGRIKEEWKDRYSGIKTCNLLLENIDRIEGADATLISRMKAEARFLRGFQHFQLMTWFGSTNADSQRPNYDTAESYWFMVPVSDDDWANSFKYDGNVANKNADIELFFNASVSNYTHKVTPL